MKNDKRWNKIYTGEVNFTTERYRRPYKILLYLKDGSHFPTQIAKRLGMKRETLAYWIRRLEDEGLCYCTNPNSNKFKQYKITPAGEKAIGLFDSTVPSDKKIEVQNARFKCYIRKQENFLPFIQNKDYQFRQSNKELRNNVVYHGKVEGVTITIIHGARKIDKLTMIMTSPSFYAKTAREGNYIMYQAMMQFQDYIDKKWNLDISRIEIDSEHVEFGLETPWASAMMTRTKGSPIKNSLFAVNQSPPSLRPKEEFHDAEIADKHLLLPFEVDRLQKKVDEIQGSKEELIYKVDQAMTSISSLTESISKLADHSKTTNESIANMATKLTELATAISGKNSAEKSKTGEEQIPAKDITDDARRMFG
jgi:DNA-binding MarR family transcriptional regulator